MTKWIQSLNNKDRESFLEFCKKTASPVQIYLFSRFLGFQGTIVECNEWSEKEFKKRYDGLFCRKGRRRRRGAHHHRAIPPVVVCSLRASFLCRGRRRVVFLTSSSVDVVRV